MKKPNGVSWTIPEQLVKDPISGLTIEFRVVGGVPRICLYKEDDLPVFREGMMREILFDGAQSTAGSAGTGGFCEPWHPDYGKYVPEGL